MGAAEDLELRVVVPRAAFGQPPHADFFSQKNSLELLGLPPRTFLELLRRDDAPTVTHVGKLRLVEREPMLAFLRALRRAAPNAPSPAAELEGPAKVLAEIGAHPVPRRRVG
ncbi:MAG: hypothetical protein KC619_02045 [Myxococcales bacterium]|nr:hypothetical protein [Myxococcales bacterium]